MGELSLASKKLIATLLKKVGIDNENVNVNEIMTRINRTEIERILDGLSKLNIIDVKNGMITKGKVYSERDKYLLFLNINKICNASPKGDRALRINFEATPLVNGVEERIHQSNRFNAEKTSRVIRFKKINRKNLLDENKKGKGEWEKEVDPKLIKFRVTFDPPLEVGEIIKYGFYTWDEKYFPLTMEELHKRYNMDYSMEGITIGQPTYYVKITINLPWVPKNVKAEKVLVVTLDGPHEGVEIQSKHRLVVDRNKITLELWQPDYGTYFLKWQPPE
ncbi:MAG: hypothetical protein QXY87_09210 [Saccharolobus sp.]|uniref:hypothetical protein n=1 Tax=Saccharolobus TaxID=2100760 RepID=UPI001F0E8F5F|nr:hypothetical protein [Saccharolobus shibatae]MCH4816192.1 hypothetical protein [Saccharolobus shibatae]